MKQNISLITKIGIFSVSLLATTFAAYMYSPVTKTHADSDASTNVTLTIPSQLSFYVDSDDVVYMTADTDSFVSGTAHFTVATNSQYGYSLMLEDVDGDTSLKNRTVASSSEITSSFIGAKTSSTMAANTWGYSLNSTDFHAIPVFGSADRIRYISTFPSSNSEMVTDVDFGVKVGRVSKSGYYADVLLATAVVNGIDGLPDYTMQNFECVLSHHDWMYDEEENGYDEIFEKTYHLRDIRNGRVYEVVATKDGNCWMAENLDIADYNIAMEDSNIPRWSSNRTPYQLPDSTVEWSFDYDNGEVYDTDDYGMYYNANAATAGAITGTSNSYNPDRSVCPAGWTLPSEYYFRNLFNAYGLDLDSGESNTKADAMALPIKLTMSGAYTVSEGLTGVGLHGGWWTQNYGAPSNKRSVVMLDDSGAKYVSADKRDGYSIRCVKSGSHYDSGAYDLSEYYENGGGNGGGIVESQ